MKLHSIILVGLFSTLGLASLNASAADDLKTIVSIYENGEALAGQTVSVQGKVVKVVKGIKKRNFIHIQDGTGDAKAETNELTGTSQQLANVGDQVVLTGVLVINRDFGSGYLFPRLLEDTTIAPAAKP
jgi:tartrate dehydratase beta subunit/fumarate hydratase class I family protein